MTSSFVNAPNQYITASDGTRYAYRVVGEAGTPLVCLQHFTGTMDSWDPMVIGLLARNRRVIVFDSAGVGASGGRVPDTVEGMTIHAEAFIHALGTGEVDLLGFSLGGFIAQAMAARRKVPVRRIISAGSAPQGGEEHLLQVVAEAFAKGASDVRLPLFFTPSARSQSAGAAFIARAAVRTAERDPDSDDTVSAAQATAIIGWCAADARDHALLRSIEQPTLIVHGSDDTMFPVVNAYEMFKHMRDATLILYPDSGHGALFQFPETFAFHANVFLTARS